MAEKKNEEETKGGEPTEIAPKTLALGGGGRYDYLSKAMGYKKEIPGVGFGLGIDRIIEASIKIPKPRIYKKPKVYFIQLGTEAKMKSLKVIEVLRQGKIPVRQSLSKDSLGSQLAIAEKSAIPHTLIFGQKEALENTIIVRDMSNRFQETVEIENLAKYLKSL